MVQRKLFLLASFGKQGPTAICSSSPTGLLVISSTSRFIHRSFTEHHGTTTTASREFASPPYKPPSPTRKCTANKSLLLHRLPYNALHKEGFLTQAPALGELLSPKSPVLVSQPNFSGKSRMIAEVCCTRYAIILCPGKSFPATADFEEFAQSHIRVTHSSAGAHQMVKPLQALVLSRLVALDNLLARFGPVMLSPRDWLLAQLNPGRHLKNRDAFSHVASLVRDREDLDLMDIVKDTRNSIQKRIPGHFQPIPIFVDEVDLLLEPSASGNGADSRLVQAAMKALTKFSSAAHLPLCISGTPRAVSPLEKAFGGTASHFSPLDTLSQGEAVWENFASVLLPEELKNQFISEAFPVLKAQGGHVGLFCEQYLKTHDFGESLALTKQLLEQNTEPELLLHQIGAREKKSSKWTDSDMQLLVQLAKIHGTKWTFLSKFFPSRTPSTIKENYKRAIAAVGAEEQLQTSSP